ncbi:MAG TPA: endolytic transglycosylase MltG [Terriglobales bacterium]|nr:endolytic transglycosylase MltG [Terriglobales bacterium]
MRRLFLFTFFVLLGIAGWLAFGLLVPVSPGGQKFVLLRQGYSTRRIARELKAAGVIRSRNAFVLWHALHRRPSLKAGEYVFDHDANVISVHQRLAHGDVYVHTVVIPEGFNIFDIAKALETAGLGPGQDFVKVATTDTSLISDFAPHATSLEGYLFPNTYEFTRTQTMHDMAAEMVKQFRQVSGQIGLGPTSAPSEPQDVQKVVTLASIIEKETAIAEERPEVASVYMNRLATRIPLQADPCVIYAEQLGGTYAGALHHNDMQFDSAYNTYRHPGLPPGPIANPGKGSLLAAMHPAQTGFYYFVSDGNGHHRFATTLDEHNKNVAALRRVVAQQR